MSRQNSVGAWECVRRKNPAVTNTLLPSPLPQMGWISMAVTTVQHEMIGARTLKQQ